MSETSPKAGRPLSPHLWIYRWPVTMATSITHRATGVANYAGTFFLAWWLFAAAIGKEAYEGFQAVAGSPIGLIVLFGYTWSLIYHMINGVRHLFWDTGGGFNNATAEATGIFVYIVSFGATLFVWIVGVAGMGGGQ